MAPSWPLIISTSGEKVFQIIQIQVQIHAANCSKHLKCARGPNPEEFPGSANVASAEAPTGAAQGADVVEVAAPSEAGGDDDAPPTADSIDARLDDAIRMHEERSCGGEPDVKKTKAKKNTRTEYMDINK